MVAGGSAGGILQLLELIEEHPVAAARDFRERFGVSVTTVGDQVTYKEAVLLVASLMADPTSWLQAARAGWEHPTSWEAIALYDLYDLQHRSKVERPSDFRSYPRPWNKPRRTSLTAKAALKILNKQ